ncbi:thioredoxin family protein [Pontibacter chitinilyticus]|uniref:thioredoxin family protein n=1 Tax=Pontibacter chitinilyticus TaxID=2674989 RepID=UPI00321B21BB
MELFAITAPAMLNPRSYPAYRSVVEELVRQQKTTGPEQTERRIDLTRQNWQRMQEVESQYELLPALQELLQMHQPQWQWVVLAEAWCADCAALVPALAAIAAASPGIKLRVLLRDENPNWMDSSLTKGSRAIPKLVCYAAASGEKLFSWGPRPLAIQEQLNRFQSDHPDAPAEEENLFLHTRYAQDRSKAVQQDLLALVQEALKTDEQREPVVAF